jgi:hypothetical protein
MNDAIAQGDNIAIVQDWIDGIDAVDSAGRLADDTQLTLYSAAQHPVARVDVEVAQLTHCPRQVSLDGVYARENIGQTLRDVMLPFHKSTLCPRRCSCFGHSKRNVSEVEESYSVQ